MGYLTVCIKYKLRGEVWAGSIELVVFESIGKERSFGEKLWSEASD